MSWVSTAETSGMWQPYWQKEFFLTLASDAHEKGDVCEHESRRSPAWSCLRVRKPLLKVFAASSPRFWRSAHGTIQWITILLQSAQQLPPHTPHYHADFFLPPSRHRGHSEWLIIPDNHVCLSHRFSSQISVEGALTCTSQSSTQIGLFLWPALL